MIQTIIVCLLTLLTISIDSFQNNKVNHFFGNYLFLTQVFYIFGLTLNGAALLFNEKLKAVVGVTPRKRIHSNKHKN